MARRKGPRPCRGTNIEAGVTLRLRRYPVGPVPAGSDRDLLEVGGGKGGDGVILDTGDRKTLLQEARR